MPTPGGAIRPRASRDSPGGTPGNHPPGRAKKRRAACAASSASTVTPRRRTSPTSGCTRCSIAGRRAPASSPATARSSSCTAAWGTSSTCSRRTELGRLKGDNAIGHVRYSTAGGSFLKNAQPLAVDYARGSLAVAHNGNLTNAEALREKLEARGSIFQSVSDTEVIVHLIAMSTQRAVEDRIADALAPGARARTRCSVLTEQAMIAVRDPMGIRPLCLGVMPGSPSAHVVVERADELRPDRRRVRARRRARRDGGHRPPRRAQHAPVPERAARKSCIFEYVYFARPDSHAGRHQRVRGAQEPRPRPRATSTRSQADVVIPVPDSGVPGDDRLRRAESGIPFEMGLVRSHYVGRTFIEPQQSIRHFGVRLKLNPSQRHRCAASASSSSTTASCAARRAARSSRCCATPARARCTCASRARRPRWPCFYGIDTPTRGELIASSHSVEEINQYITSDSLAYLSLDAMLDAVTSGPPQARRATASRARSRWLLRRRSDELVLPRLLERRVPDRRSPRTRASARCASLRALTRTREVPRAPGMFQSSSRSRLRLRGLAA